MFVIALPQIEKGTQSSQKGRYCSIKADTGKNINAKQAEVILFGFLKNTALCIHHFICQHFLRLNTMFPYS